MNRKGELIITLGIFLTLILFTASFIVINDELKKDITVTYIGDNSTKIAYNIKSENYNCNLHNIKIEQKNVVYFKDKEEALSQDFQIDENCN